MSAWYVVRTKTGSEDRAVWHLQNQGFETYLPHYQKQIRHARKTSTVLRPLFPGYVFVSLSLESQQWRAINSTVGVIGLVQFGSKPSPVPADMMAAIHDREDENGVVSLLLRGLKKGDAVTVHDGAFAGYSAILAEDSDKQRVMVMLNLMGREVRATVPVQNLAKAS